ncbi:Glucoamylase, intracellular sporulation-specific [Geranomyces michiganensis]|nr:Glucoamylase, intracellular sporulation-specific [Geranomyces michiganensis]
MSLLLHFLGKLFLCLPLLIVLASSVPTRHGYEDDDLDAWLARQTESAVEGLLANISPDHAMRGTVVAGTSKSHPDYWYHWTRDSALVMSVVNGLYARSPVGSETSSLLETRMWEYVRFSNWLRFPPRDGDDGLGEPKYNVDGSTFTGPWARPQNDGPALRALTTMRFLITYLDYCRGDIELVHDHVNWGLYLDLAYIASPYTRNPSRSPLSFDLWEESKGNHFYTRMVQQAALLVAMQGFGDPKHHGDTVDAMVQLEDLLPNHWSSNKGHILETLDWAGGVKYKTSNLDTATLLAVLHTRPLNTRYKVLSPEIQATFLRLLDTFEPLYAINSEKFDPVGNPLAPALGRYAEDVYDGYSTSKGNPWVLLTAAAAEYVYATIVEWFGNGEIQLRPELLPFINRITGNRDDARPPRDGRSIPLSDPLFHAMVSNATAFGDSFLNRVRRHAPPDGRLSEQMNRDTGFMQGATDLTWSYASIITANWAREDVKKARGNAAAANKHANPTLYRQDRAQNGNALPSAGYIV